MLNVKISNRDRTTKSRGGLGLFVNYELRIINLLFEALASKSRFIFDAVRGVHASSRVFYRLQRYGSVGERQLSKPALRGFSLEVQFYRFSDIVARAESSSFCDKLCIATLVNHCSARAASIAKAIELRFEAKASKSRCYLMLCEASAPRHVYSIACSDMAASGTGNFRSERLQVY
jgi:hypothetical protein